MITAVAQVHKDHQTDFLVEIRARSQQSRSDVGTEFLEPFHRFRTNDFWHEEMDVCYYCRTLFQIFATPPNRSLFDGVTAVCIKFGSKQRIPCHRPNEKMHFVCG